MMPIRKGDGTGLSASGFSEVRKGDGTVLWSAGSDIPDSGILLYTVGDDNNSVYQYSVSTAFDVSTASFSQSLDVSAQDTTPIGMTWNPDGSKLYVVGLNAVDINEYALSTAFDLSTASFSQSLDVSAQDSDPQDCQFDSDGTKLFVVGFSTDSIHEYALSTAFDVSTASFSQSLDVSTNATDPFGAAWNSNGAKLFVSNFGGSVNEYTLSTAFDVSTASFSQSLDVSAQDEQPRDVLWNADGTKMYVVGNSTDSIHEYALSTAFDVSTASFSQSFDVSAQDTTQFGGAWNGAPQYSGYNG